LPYGPWQRVSGGQVIAVLGMCWAVDDWSRFAHRRGGQPPRLALAGLHIASVGLLVCLASLSQRVAGVMKYFVVFAERR
jgi:hypothetical protein